MKKVKQLKGWAICENNKKEIEEYGFKFSVIHPNNVEVLYQLNPSDSDIECDTIEQAQDWIKNY